VEFEVDAIIDCSLIPPVTAQRLLANKSITIRYGHSEPVLQDVTQHFHD
jgi:hypothetical protein